MKFWKKKKTDKLNDAMNRILEEMETFPTYSEEYAKCAANLEKLKKADSYGTKKLIDRTEIVKTLFSTTIPTAAVLVFENRGVITAKVFSKIRF